MAQGNNDIGRRIEVWYPLRRKDQGKFYSGRVFDYSETTQRHKIWFDEDQKIDQINLNEENIDFQFLPPTDIETEDQHNLLGCTVKAKLEPFPSENYQAVVVRATRSGRGQNLSFIYHIIYQTNERNADLDPKKDEFVILKNSPYSTPSAEGNRSTP